MSERDVRLYIEDMLEFCERAMQYAHGFGREALVRDTMRYDAILRNIELIGEASTHVGAVEKALAPHIPWREIVGVRNRVAHAYLGISTDTVWDLLTVEIPRLRGLLVELLAALPDNAPDEPDHPASCF